MKRFLIIALVSLFGFTGLAQEVFKREFKIKNYIELKGKDTVFLVVDTVLPFSSLPPELQKQLRQKYENTESIAVSYEEELMGQKINVTITKKADEDFIRSLTVTKPKKVTLLQDNLKGYAIFKENKVLINPNLTVDEQGNYKEGAVMYYKLENRQTIRLRFSDITISGITIPIKYRFGDKSKNISETFETSFNANLFAGYTIFGSRSFHYRKEAGNISNVNRLVFGGFLGLSSLKLNESNTSASFIPIPAGEEYSQGLVSFGLGLNYSFNKINIGAFYGWDYSLGEKADKWNFNKEPWLGIAIGYSLLNL